VLPVFIDEGLPSLVADALRVLRLEAFANGHSDAPPKGSADDVNVPWCAQRKAVMITNDRGRKQPMIRNLLTQHRVHAIFVYNDLRARPPHALARALLCAEPKIDQLAAQRNGLISHRLTENGGLTKRSRS
jgi:hypothetical protein